MCEEFLWNHFIFVFRQEFNVSKPLPLSANGLDLISADSYLGRLCWVKFSKSVFCSDLTGENQHEIYEASSGMVTKKQLLRTSKPWQATTSFLLKIAIEIISGGYKDYTVAGMALDCGINHTAFVVLRNWDPTEHAPYRVVGISLLSRFGHWFNLKTFFLKEPFHTLWNLVCP